MQMGGLPWLPVTIKKLVLMKLMTRQVCVLWSSSMQLNCFAIQTTDIQKATMQDSVLLLYLSIVPSVCVRHIQSEPSKKV